jgi:hypothetical protein
LTLTNKLVEINEKGSGIFRSLLTIWGYFDKINKMYR